MGLLGAVLVVMLLSMGSAEAASEAGNWSTADSMISARAWDSATILPDGRILATGGMSDSRYLASAELFDSRTGRWTATSSMSTVRAYHTATLLPDGGVLVAGGTTDAQASDSAELYDPIAGTWSATGGMGAARRFHSATLLGDGRVLVAGGVLTQGKTNEALSSAELYDPATGTWTTTGAMSTPRSRHTSTLLPDGRVLVSGGLRDALSGSTLASAELYDPATGRWTTSGSMDIARAFHVAALLQDGRVLVAGGGTGNDPSPFASAELYDPATGRWAAVQPMGSARAFSAATLLGDGRVLVIGGTGRGAEVLASAELYDPRTGTWGSAGVMGVARLQSTVSLLPNGKALIAGGADSDDIAQGSLLSSVELFTP